MTVYVYNYPALGKAIVCVDIYTGVTVYSIPRLFHPGDKINYPGVKISLE